MIAAQMAAKYGTKISAGSVIEGLKQSYGSDNITNSIEEAYRMGSSSGDKFTGLKNFGVGLLSGIKSIGPGLLALAGVTAAIATWKWADDKFTLTKDSANRHYDESKEKVKISKSDLESTKQQYDSNKNRIKELRIKQNPTLEESSELADLEKENKLLSKQVVIKEQVNEVNNKALASDAYTKLTKSTYRLGGVLNMNTDNDIEYASEQIKELNDLKAKREKLLSEQSSIDQEKDKKDFEKKQKDIDKLDKKISKKESDVSSMINEINEVAQDMYNEDGTLVYDTEDYQKLDSQIKSLLDDYLGVSDKAAETQSKIKNLFAKSDFMDVEEKLVSIGKAKGTNGVLKKSMKLMA